MDLNSFITWLLIILGWLFVHIATLQRERRKERRDTAFKIIEEIREIEAKAIKFQSSSEFNSQDFDSLIWRINRIINKLQRPPLKYLHVHVNMMMRFRQNLTQNTDFSTFVMQTHDGNIIRCIHEVSDELIDEIEAGIDIYFS